MKNKSNLWFGGLLILAGFVFLMVNAGLMSFEVTRIVISWQMLIVVIGLISLVRRHSPNFRRIWGKQV